MMSPYFKGFGGGVLGGSMDALFGSYALGFASMLGLWSEADGWCWPRACEVFAAEFLYYLWDGWVKFSG